MSAKPFEFEYEIHETVRVRAIGLDGVVLQRCDRGGGQCDYQVVYWCESKRNVEWLVAHELEPT